MQNRPVYNAGRLTSHVAYDFRVGRLVSQPLYRQNTDYLMLQTCQNFNVMNKTCQKKSIVVVKLNLKLD